MDHVKTVRVTNPRNVLVQVPAYIMAKWYPVNQLEVLYNEHTKEVTIRPYVQR